MDPLARALRFAWEVQDASADEVERVPLGTALRTRWLPRAYDVNCLRVEGPSELSLEELARAADDVLAHVPYRRLRVEDERTALRLIGGPLPPGWSSDRELVMLLAAAPREVPGDVRDGTLDEVLELVRAWYVEEGHRGEELDQVCAMTRRGHTARDERRFVVDHDGAPAAMCSLRRDGSGVAQLEDVYVVPPARGLGLGAAVVSAAARAAAAEAHDVVFIVADDADWPKDLYARSGFAPAGRRVILQRA